MYRVLIALMYIYPKQQAPPRKSLAQYVYTHHLCIKKKNRQNLRHIHFVLFHCEKQKALPQKSASGEQVTGQTMLKFSVRPKSGVLASVIRTTVKNTVNLYMWYSCFCRYE